MLTALSIGEPNREELLSHMEESVPEFEHPIFPATLAAADLLFLLNDPQNTININL